MIVRAIVCSTFQSGVAPTGVEIPILGGSVTLDATADIRSTLDLTTDGTRMWPHRAADTLAPYGNEIYVERGILYGNGTQEWVGLGYHRIDTPDQNMPPDGPIRIDGKDRMAGLIDGRLLAPAQFEAIETYGSVVDELVLEVYPSALIDWDSGESDQIGRSLIVEEDRHGFLDDLVRSLGKIWYWDHRGRLQIRDAPSVDAPVFDVYHGTGGVLVSMSRELTRQGVYNAVVASGEATDTLEPVRAVAVDNNAESPTYFYGRFGPVPMFFTSPFLTTETQAQSAADAILRRQLGLPYSVDFSMVPNVALEPWDPVRVRYSDRDGPETHVLQTVGIPLVPEQAMAATTREQTTVLIGAA